MIGYFNLVNNLNNYVNYYFIIIIVPEKPLWGGSIKYVCMYVYVCIIIVIVLARALSSFDASLICHASSGMSSEITAVVKTRPFTG